MKRRGILLMVFPFVLLHTLQDQCVDPSSFHYSGPSDRLQGLHLLVRRAGKSREQSFMY